MASASDSVPVRRAQAICFEAIGQASLRLCDVPAPGPGELRIRVLACGICQRELHVLAGRIGREFPIVMGHEPVGVVDAIGPGVAGFRVGECVTGVGTASLAEYDNVEARFIVSLSYQPDHPELWLGEPAMCAVNAINRARWPANAAVAVNGAGFMGNLLIQAARWKHPSATIVAADTDPERRALAEAAGADAACEPCLDDMRALLGRHADLVYEASGAEGTLSACTSLVRNGGTLCIFAHHFGIEGATVSEWHLRGITVLNTVPWSAPRLDQELRAAVGAMESGRLRLADIITDVVRPAEARQLLSEMRPSAPGRKVVVLF